MDLRASDSDRERVAAQLRQHYGAGRVSEEELSDRVEAAYAARTLAELDHLTADLPSDRTAPTQRRRRSGLETSVRIHATVFLVVNLMLIAIWAAAGGGYFWPIWPILGWGIGLGSHAAPLLAGGGRRRRRHRELRGPTVVDEMATTVATERPSLTAAAAPDGTVTLMFSDIEGSTALNERLGDVRWLELLQRHDRIVR